jgi:hypothetical protein
MGGAGGAGAVCAVVVAQLRLHAAAESRSRADDGSPDDGMGMKGFRANRGWAPVFFHGITGKITP